MKRLLTSVFMVILILLSVSVPAIGIENRGNIQDDVPVSAQNITIQLLTPFGVENFTVEVSGEDIQNLNKIINETKWKLKNASSMFEVKKIFNETVERLADYGFLPRHRIKEIQSLVTDGNRFFHLLQLIVNKSQQFGMSDNLVCLVCGRMTNTLTLPPIRFLINTLARITLLPILEVLFIIFCTLDQYTNFSFISRMADFFWNRCSTNHFISYPCPSIITLAISWGVCLHWHRIYRIRNTLCLSIRGMVVHDWS